MPVTAVQRRPCRYRTSYPLEELEVVLADGSHLALVRKDLRRAALDETARRAKPSFLHDPRREIEAYRLLAPYRLGTPALYDHGDDWVLLEKVEGSELWQIGELEVWQRAARWLAELHMLFADAAPGSPHLLRYDARFYRRWAERAHQFAGPSVDRIVSCYDAIIDRLCGLDVTFVHGEFYPSNVLVAGSRIAPVDWETAAVGPGLVDLAALATGTWTAAERAAIVAAYGEVDPEALDCCRLHIAVQWLGWSRSWIPPAEHAHDWLSEAADAATRLGLLS
jgi:aminoglycoside phosphotransferase (APT) family kinase protein